jgi:non-homologous end joining protein Ku
MRCETSIRFLKRDKVNISKQELELGAGLIDKLSAKEFSSENYKDEYRIRVVAMLDEKTKGKEITISAPQRGGKFVDIMEALNRSEFPPRKTRTFTTKKRKCVKLCFSPVLRRTRRSAKILECATHIAGSCLPA